MHIDRGSISYFLSPISYFQGQIYIFRIFDISLFQVKFPEKVFPSIEKHRPRPRLPYGIAIWPCHMALPYGFAIWHCHMALMALPYGTAIWHCHMTFPYGTAIWPCHMTKNMKLCQNGLQKNHFRLLRSSLGSVFNFTSI